MMNETTPAAGSRNAANERSREYSGVMRTPCFNRRKPRLHSRPWKAQLRALGYVFYLGSFESEIEAAEAYDNAAYWASVHSDYRYRFLNFPENYTLNGVKPIEPFGATPKVIESVKILSKQRQSGLSHRKPVVLSQVTSTEQLAIAHAVQVERALNRFFKALGLPPRYQHADTEPSAAPTESPAPEATPLAPLTIDPANN